MTAPQRARYGAAVLGTIGDVVHDVVARLSGPVQWASDTPAEVVHRRGGSAANVAVTAAGLGCPARFIGQIGADSTGDWLLGTLRAEGVEVVGRRGGRSGTVVALVDATGERSMITDRGDSGALADPDPAWVAGLAALHVPFYSLASGELADTATTLLGIATASGVRCSIDASSVSVMTGYGIERLAALLRSLALDVLLCNGDEGAALGRWLSPEALAVRTIVVKHGARPAVLLRAGRDALEIPAAPVRVVTDTTGAGDAFAAGFLVAGLRGADDEAAVRAGHTAAARLLEAHATHAS